MHRISIRERPDFEKTISGFGLKTNNAGLPYWRENAAYQFTLHQIENDLENPAQETHNLCLKLLDKLIGDDEYFKRLNIPSTLWSYIRKSYEAKEPSLYGRFDFAYDGTSPAKLLEYNADTPTSLFESSILQWLWLEENLKRGELSRGADQFNSLHDKLIDQLNLLQPTHLAGILEEDDDRLTLDYLLDCAQLSGLRPQKMAMQDIGYLNNAFIDLENIPIARLFKLYPWEWMIREDFSKHLETSKIRLIEPPWKMLLSTKILLPELWKAYPDHPNLLASYHHDEPHSLENYVIKPIFSREGANITLIEKGVQTLYTQGDYANQPTISQDFHKTRDFDGFTPTLGLWIVGQEAAGLGIREENSVITTNKASFVPHFIL